MAWGREIGHRTGLFFVPRVLDVTTTTIVQERLLGFVQLRDSSIIKTHPAETGRRLAQILVAIHESPDTVRTDCVYSQHGDFTCENILYNAATDIIAIVDWSEPTWHIQTGLHVGQHMDLATLAMSVFASNPFGNGLPDAEATIGNFLSQYRLLRPDSTALHDLRAEFPDILRRFYNHDWSLLTRARLWGYRLSYARASKFIQRENF